MCEKLFISIISPVYHTPIKEISELVESINIQQHFDHSLYEIIFVIDDNSKQYEEILSKKFPEINIKYIYNETNLGPGLARQEGIDVAQGEYLLFCDSDDLICNPFFLSDVYSEVTTREMDILFYKWIEEIKKDDNSYVYSEHANDRTWMHGKIFKTEFIKKNGIHFDAQSSFSNEDNRFNLMAFLLTDKIFYSDKVVYTWRANQNSITRRDNFAYSYTNMKGYIKAIHSGLHWLIINHQDRLTLKEDQLEACKKGLFNPINRIISTFIYIYFVYNEWLVNGIPEQYIIDMNLMLAAIGDFYEEFKNVFDFASDDIWNLEYNNRKDNYKFIPKISVNEFKKILEAYIKLKGENKNDN